MTTWEEIHESLRPKKKPNHIPDALRAGILALASQEDIHSVSCPFTDLALWDGLLSAQSRRVSSSGDEGYKDDADDQSDVFHRKNELAR